MDSQVQNEKPLKTLIRIFGYLPYRRQKQFFMILGGMILSAGFETLTLSSIAFYASVVNDPGRVLSSTYVDTFINVTGLDFFNNSHRLIMAMSLIVVSFVLVKNAILSSLKYLITRFSLIIRRHFGKLILSGFLKLPYEWHLSKNSADLILAVQWSYYFQGIAQSTLDILCDVFVVSLMFIAVILIEPKLSLTIILFLGIVSMFIFIVFRRLIDKYSLRSTVHEESMNRFATRALHGIKDIKIFRKETSFINDYNSEVKGFERIGSYVSFLVGLPAFILESVGFIAITSSVFIMLLMTTSSNVNVMGAIALLVVAAWRVLPAVKRILGSINLIRSFLPYIWKELEYIELFDSEPKPKSEPFIQTERVPVFNDTLRLRNISFSYQGKSIYALQGIELTIEKGETVGIIGASGAGKSTLVDILMGLLVPSKGNIWIDGKVMDGDKYYDWINIVGYVPQTPYILDGSLAQNIAFGFDDVSIDRERVLVCCKMAAIDFLDNLANGIDTIIGERGLLLSGGERQRVAIARALYKKPKVIIFDEATSSLDTKSEKAIQKTIYSLKGGEHTLVIVSHRLSTVEDCDFIAWVEKGEIKKAGNSNDIISEYSKMNDAA